mgnify:CR=1 FL=1
MDVIFNYIKKTDHIKNVYYLLVYENGQIGIQEREIGAIPSYDELLMIKNEIDETLLKGRKYIEQINIKRLEEYSDWLEEEFGTNQQTSKPKTKQKRKKEWGYVYLDRKSVV